MKNILAVDTASSVLGISLKVNEKITSKEINDGFKHSENLAPMIKELISNSGIDISELDLLVCSRGPGSFTGLRIGMATLKGISMALNIPLVSVSTMDLYAYGKDDFNGVVLPVIDARKRCFYTALYRNGNKETEELDINTDEIKNLLKDEQHILITGVDAPLLFSKVEDSRFTLDNKSQDNYSIELLDLGEIKYRENGPDHIDQGPTYIRKSEAEIHLENKIAKEKGSV